MQGPIYLTVIASLLLAGAPAFAKGKRAVDSREADKEAKEREARKACLEGDYAKGVGILSDLFLDFKVPTYIFNQGRCYEQNERYDEAISRFREYLRTGTEDIPLAEKHIAECEALRQKKAAPVTPSEPLPAAAPVRSMSQQETPMAVQQPQPPVPASGSGLRAAGVVIVSVGVAAAVAGLVLNLKANSLAKSIEPPNTYDRGKESTRNTYETLAWVGYGVAGAGVVAGAILYGIGWSKGRKDDTLSFVPAIGPDLAGASLQGVF